MTLVSNKLKFGGEAFFECCFFITVRGFVFFLDWCFSCIYLGTMLRFHEISVNEHFFVRFEIYFNKVQIEMQEGLCQKILKDCKKMGTIRLIRSLKKQCLAIDKGTKHSGLELWFIVFQLFSTFWWYD